MHLRYHTLVIAILSYLFVLFSVTSASSSATPKRSTVVKSNPLDSSPHERATVPRGLWWTSLSKKETHRQRFQVVRKPKPALSPSELQTAKISRALDGGSSKLRKTALKKLTSRQRIRLMVKAARRARKTVAERAAEMVRMEEWRKRMETRRDDVRKGLEERLGRRVGRWEKEQEREVVVMPLGGMVAGKKKKRGSVVGKATKLAGKGRKMMKRWMGGRQKVSEEEREQAEDAESTAEDEQLYVLETDV